MIPLAVVSKVPWVSLLERLEEICFALVASKDQRLVTAHFCFELCLGKKLQSLIAFFSKTAGLRVAASQNVREMQQCLKLKFFYRCKTRNAVFSRHSAPTTTNWPAWTTNTRSSSGAGRSSRRSSSASRSWWSWSTTWRRARTTIPTTSCPAWACKTCSCSCFVRRFR